MIWRSVVGKLWMTILGLVAVVLIILTVFLLQFFKNYYTDQTEQKLTNLANQVASIMEKYDKRNVALSTNWEIMNAHSTKALIIKDSGHYWPSPEQKGLPDLPISVFYGDQTLSKVFQHNKTVVKIGSFPVEEKNSQENKQILIVGVPMHLDAEQGAVFLYQSLDVIRNTTNQAMRLIYISAGIAIVLTTIFAFFLSTRITAPLRRMREAATEVAKGRFDMKVPIVSRDEIGSLAVAFNRMSMQLKDNLTALNQEKEQLSSILSSMADGVITFDRTGRILVTNPPADRFIQSWHNEQKMDGERMLPEEVRDLFEQVVRSVEEQMTEVEIQGRIWVIVMTPLYNPPYIRGAVAVLRDMTEERRMDKLRIDFIANVSHELRTPIAMLRGYSEAIVDDVAGTEEEKREIAQIIYEESLRMGRLVNELLDLARMEAGHMRMNKVDVGIHEFFERVIRKFHGIVKEQEVNLHLDIFAGKDEMATFDPDRIEQVMTNLIDNAIRHTEKGGMISIEVKTSSKSMRVDVRDTGSGIPEDDLPFVFERFYKADKARTRGRSGTGLGLAIAKNFVEAHGGMIAVNSKLGEGTTFHFFIPKNIPS